MHYYDELPRHRWNSIIIIAGVLFRSKTYVEKKTLLEKRRKQTTKNVP